MIYKYPRVVEGNTVCLLVPAIDWDQYEATRSRLSQSVEDYRDEVWNLKKRLENKEKVIHALQKAMVKLINEGDEDEENNNDSYTDDPCMYDLRDWSNTPPTGQMPGPGEPYLSNVDAYMRELQGYVRRSDEED